MGFNYGYETKKLNDKWNVLRQKYKAAGMSEADIWAMREFDWETLNGERRFRTHTQVYEGFSFSDDGDDNDDDKAEEGQSPLLKKYPRQMSTPWPEISEWGRYGWVEDIDTPELVRSLKSLSATDLEILTMMMTDNMKRAEVSRQMGVSRAAVTKRINRIKKILEKFRHEG